MEVVYSRDIARIDALAERAFGLSPRLLMERSGEAVAARVRARFREGATVLILCGPGNNGGDGYAAAVLLRERYRVLVCDVLGTGCEGTGRVFFDDYRLGGGRTADASEACSALATADCVIDAIFGVGGRRGYSPTVLRLAAALSDSPAWKIAVDVPLGVDADTGCVFEGVYRADETVALSYYKLGQLSYPARAFVGALRLATLGLDRDAIRTHIQPKNHCLDEEFVRRTLPRREEDSNKSTFGRALLLTGSPNLIGAAFLSLEATLRGGAGYVTYLGTDALVDRLLPRFPEAIYGRIVETDALTPTEIAEVVARSCANNATLIGCGGGAVGVALLAALLRSRSSPIVLDADAINALAACTDRGAALLRGAERPVILTPHPLEFSRLCGATVEEIQADRIERARDYAHSFGVVLVLKGAATVVTDGDRVYVNTTGSSALAKAGSGDVLAGLLTSLAAMGVPPMEAAALAVCLHGMAGDRLAARHSRFGVTPSDLPVAIAEEMARVDSARTQEPHRGAFGERS